MTPDVTVLRKMAARLRLDVMEMVYGVKDGHPGPAFSIADIPTCIRLPATMPPPAVLEMDSQRLWEWPRD